MKAPKRISKQKVNVRIARNFLKLKDASGNMLPYLRHEDPEAQSVDEYKPVGSIVVANAQVVTSNAKERGFDCSKVVIGLELTGGFESLPLRPMFFHYDGFLDSTTKNQVPDRTIMVFKPDGMYYVQSVNN